MNDDLGEFVGKGFALLRDRLKAVEARKPVNGIDGDDAVVDYEKIRLMLPAPIPGKDGVVDYAKIEAMIPDPVKGDDAVVDYDKIRLMIPNPIPGKDGDDAVVDYARIEAMIPDPIPGQDAVVDYAKIRAMIPPPVPGKDATATDGSDGVGIADLKIDRRGHLIVTLDDGAKKDAGKLPKGKDGQSYQGMIASGPSAASTAAPQSVVYVTSPDQLAGTLQSNKLYFIDGTVDMGSTQIVVPTGGLRIGGYGPGVSCLKSSVNNYTMFIAQAGSYSGNLSLNDLDFEVTGAGSKVVDIDNQQNSSTLEFNSVNFVACTAVGVAANYRQGLARDVAWISITDGLTLSGTWAGGFAAFDSIIVGAPMSGVLFRAGASLTLGGSFRSNINALSLGTNGGIFCDFAPVNILLDAGFALSGLRTNPLSNTLPNMPATSTKALIQDCVGIGNTYPGAAHIPVADSVITITAQNTLTQITGAMTLVEPYWFSTANTNGLRSDCAQAVEGRADGTMSFSGQANTEISVQLRHFIAATSSYENVGPEYEATINGGLLGTLASNVSFGATVTMQQGDRAEVWVKNRSGTNNITLKSGGQFEVLGR